MKLKMHISKIKCVKDLTIELPIERGLYAITGQNGSGKSTIVACASSVFFNLPMKDYFGDTANDARIEFELDGNKRSWHKEGKSWKQEQNGNMNIRGFYEGSLIYGYRFRDTTYDKLKKSESINRAKLRPSHEFIRKNLGQILQGDVDYYDKLYEVPHEYAKFDSSVFFYEKDGIQVSQFHMSTGENLLLSILNSLYIKNKERKNASKQCIIFLDEIELALHPSSLKRLVAFLEDMAKQYDYAIYFSTHSIELISGIKLDNIFYIERYTDGTIGVNNPCYPAYATKFLYDQSGYDNVLLVEDDLAKLIIAKLLRKEKLLNSRLVHVLPCGGFRNVIKLADDVTKNLLLGKRASISIILDKDVKQEAISYKQKNGLASSCNMNFLPIESLEKYLRSSLVIEVDHKLFKRLSDYIFQQRSLHDIVAEYRKLNEFKSDKSGKVFYSLLDTELRNRRTDRNELIEIIIDYMFEENLKSIQDIVSFLHKELS